MNWSEILPHILSGGIGALIAVLLELRASHLLRKRQVELEREVAELRRTSDPRAVAEAVFALREGSRDFHRETTRAMSEVLERFEKTAREQSWRYESENKSLLAELRGMEAERDETLRLLDRQTRNLELLLLKWSPEIALESDVMEPQIVANWLATASAVLQAAEVWMSFRDRAQARVSLSAKTDVRDYVTEAERVSNLLPAKALNSLIERTNRCFSDFEATLEDDSYSEQELDRASIAVRACVCRWLRRIQLTNGAMPTEHFQRLWDSYGCAHPA